MRSKHVVENRGYGFEVVKANIIALIAALILILLSALIIKIFTVSDSVVPIINQIIKSVSIFLGCIIALKKPNNGWLRGMVCGFVFVWLSYLIFSLLASQFTFGLSLLNDCVLGTLSGMFGGIFAVNMRKNRG